MVFLRVSLSSRQILIVVKARPLELLNVHIEFDDFLVIQLRYVGAA